MLEEEDPLRWKLVLPRISQVKYTEAAFHVNNVNNKDLLQLCSEGGRPREDIGRRRDKRREPKSMLQTELGRPGHGRLALKRREQKSVQEIELSWPGLGRLALKRGEQKSVQEIELGRQLSVQETESNRPVQDHLEPVGGVRARRYWRAGFM